tara:strand:- start:235 stop:483 length:249 start_codon:yes stop_codon:yes gene_type:complete
MSHGTTIMGDKKFPELKPCSVQHDMDYIERVKTRGEADADFRNCMRKVCSACTAPERARQLRMAALQRYFFVRAFGWVMWYT